MAGINANGTPIWRSLRSWINDNYVRMYGLNTDGDVNGDDKFWIGLKCH